MFLGLSFEEYSFLTLVVRSGDESRTWSRFREGWSLKGALLSSSSMFVVI